MRIALICQSYPPMVSGAASMGQRLAHGLARRGHAVLVVAASDRGRAYREFAGGAEVVRLRAYPNPFRNRQRFVLWPGPALPAALLAFEPDIVHLHDPLIMGLPGLRAGRRLRRPVVLTLHALPNAAAAYGPPVPGLKRVVEAALWAYGRAFVARCQALAAPSAAVAEAVYQHTSQSAHLIAGGVDLDVFTDQPAFMGEAEILRRKYRLLGQLPVILYVGRLDVDKQVEFVLRAAAGALREMPAQLLIVGDGTQRRALTALGRQLGIGDQTHFTGFVSPMGDLPSLYRLATVFVTSSQTETQGLSVVEAAACGLPVIAVNATSMPEMVQHGVTGYLVTPGDGAAMTRLILGLLTDQARARAMGQAGRSTIAQRFAFEATLTSYEDLYQKLLLSAERRAAPARIGR